MCSSTVQARVVLPGIRLTASLEAQPASGVLTGKCLCRNSPGSSASQSLGLVLQEKHLPFIPLLDLQTLCLSSIPSPIYTAPQDAFPASPPWAGLCYPRLFSILKFWHLRLSWSWRDCPSQSSPILKRVNKHIPCSSRNMLFKCNWSTQIPNPTHPPLLSGSYTVVH